MSEKPKYFRDPIHGFIEVDPLELKIISHPLFQRLRRIKQLGLANYVYHGADHTRFAHSLGVMHIVKRILNILRIEEEYRHKIVLAALLHDIGHPPLSHSLETALGIKHEEYSSAIIERTEIKDILTSDKFSKKDLTEIIGFISGEYAKFPLGNQLIRSEIDADRLDYLLRDSHYCGVKYGVYDLERLLISLKVLEEPHYKIVVTERGFDAIEEFILARFFMYKQVYIHKTKRSLKLSYRKF